MCKKIMRLSSVTLPCPPRIGQTILEVSFMICFLHCLRTLYLQISPWSTVGFATRNQLAPTTSRLRIGYKSATSRPRVSYEVAMSSYELATSRLRVGHESAASQLRVGYEQLQVGYESATSRLQVGYELATSQLRVGYESAMSWLRVGYESSTSFGSRLRLLWLTPVFDSPRRLALWDQQFSHYSLNKFIGSCCVVVTRHFPKIRVTGYQEPPDPTNPANYGEMLGKWRSDSNSTDNMEFILTDLEKASKRALTAEYYERLRL